MHSKPEILKVEKLTKYFGGLAAVSNCSLNIKEGSITGIIGPNGSGKSTLFNLIAGNLKPNSGKVLLEYREVYFDGPGLWAGLLARCQGNKKYFAMVDLIYKKQKDWASGNRNDVIEGLLSIGRQTGLDDQKSRKCMENSEQAKKLIDRFKKNITEDGISSTPSFVINDKLMSNMTYDKMKNIIESLLK